MKTKIFLSLTLALATALAGVAPGATAKPKAAPTVLGTDPGDDWGTNADPTLAPLGGPLGQELLEASIEKADATTLNFIIKVAMLPPQGGWPEVTRYNWDFTVNGDPYQLTGAFTDYLRGVCNPLHTGACPPPQDPGMQPFFIRQGPCTVGSDCILVGTVNATFDAAAGTITIPVPLDLVKAKTGSKIGPGVTSLGGTVYATTAAMVTYASIPNDTMTVLKTYKIPR